MKQTKISEFAPFQSSWRNQMGQRVRTRRFIVTAVIFSAANAAAAVGAILWAPEAAQTASRAPEVTMRSLPPDSAPHPIVVGDVVRPLPRAQTWTPPHMLPPSRDKAAESDAPRITPASLARPTADSPPEITPQTEGDTLAASVRPAPAREPETQLASLVPSTLNAPALRPFARPDQLQAPESSISPKDPRDTALLTVSLRPQVRPTDLKLPEPRQTAKQEEPLPSTTLAALPNVIARPVSGNACNQRLTRAIPDRKGSAKPGTSVMANLMRVGGPERDRLIAREILSGNAPKFLQDLVPVEINGRAKDGSKTSLVFCVMPDYLAVGSNRDFVRVPMGLPAAMQIASNFNMMLPTRRMVDQIYRASDLRVSPRPMTPGPQMSSTDYLLRHNATVEGQVKGASARSGALVSGHKKDLVLTNRLNSNRGRVAIYGWHRSNGKAIQPLSTVHGANYADYSHGIRLVSQTAYLNGNPVRLATLFADPAYAELISDEGPIRAAQLRLASAD